MTPGPGTVPAARDGGVSMVEMVVALAIMSVFMAMFTAGIVTTYRVVGRAQARSTAQSEIDIAYQRLDREVRYAAAISTPLQIGTDWYVEYLITVGATPTCVELRLHLPAGAATGQLQRRIWTQGASPLVPTDWYPLASDVGPTSGVGPAGAPFTALPADAHVSYQRLQIDLRATSGDPGMSGSAELHATFVALNTPPGASGAAVCTEARAINP